jgi:GT2 family glycosyltransferase
VSSPVAVAVVSYDSAADLPRCLAAVGRLEPPPAELRVVDCASRDASVETARRHLPPGIPDARVMPLAENRGFAGGTNAAIAATKSSWILTLNPDAEPAPDFLVRLLERAERSASPAAGAVTGRLLRRQPAGEPARLDACGVRLSRAWRHFDRGAGDLDRGQFGVAERVFGATGAATLWRRAALEDVAIDGECFDERFHSYREDAELCFRLRERGWEILYEPTARAVHGRRVLPERRRSLPAAVNFHSLKNRYLLRCGHQRAGNFLRTLPWTLGRDLGALAWVLVREWSSLPAYGWLWRHRREIGARRAALRARATAPPAAVERWFAIDGEPA